MTVLVVRGCDENKAWAKYSEQISEKGIAAESSNNDEVMKDWPCIARRQILVSLRVLAV